MSTTTASENSLPQRPKRLGLSVQIVIGLLAGILVGLFFGEMVAGLKLLGDAFIKLLQMTVLPYILVSLVAGVGRLDAVEARVLAVRGTAVLLAIWFLAIGLVLAAQLAFPDRETASFFSMAAVEPRPQPDVLERFIPANIFYSLTNNLVPAVVLFSILLGAALISVTGENKTQLLRILDGTSAALAAVNRLVVKLTPFGVFAIAASAAGTMTIDELERIQVYLITYIALALTVTFWIFPGLVSAVTGIRFWEVLGTYKDALMTAFATGNQFVVLPLIAENTKELMEGHRLRSERTDSAIDVLVPVSFNFPSLGKLLVLLFVLFSAWFTGTPLAFLDQLGLAFNGLVSLFGSINVAVPYLLDRLRIPLDMFQLFLVTGIVVGRLGAMLAALHIIVLGIIGTLAVNGQLRITTASVLRYLGVSALIIALLIGGLRTYFDLFVPNKSRRDAVLASMHQMDSRVDVTIRVALRPADPEASGGRGRLETILDRGVLRVGYRPELVPCSFTNQAGQLVGFEVEMAHLLAEDLGVTLEFSPVSGNKHGDALNAGQVDIIMACMAATPERLRRVDLSNSYLDLTLAFVVPDHRREDFSTRKAIQSLEEVRIAMLREGYFSQRLRRYVPQAEIIIIDHPDDFLTEGHDRADALLFAAEIGAAYSLLYPKYTVAIPEPDVVKVPLAYAMPMGATTFKNTVNAWLEMQEKNGTRQRLFDYWVMGGAAKTRPPRWSVIRDVLGWVDDES
ncbi:MAG: cation:dicarboxylase symporter family transporter [Gemmatimonadota bacterium]|nr:MAG: cation:dicarboxylase symporter family transporter [Gemmatimonadota bacterium]